MQSFQTRLALCAGLAAFALAATPAQAEFIVGLTADQQLITFDSATPGTVSAPVLINGQASGDTFVGIDRRPSLGASNGVLYGLAFNAGTGRLYTIDTATGAATLASTLSVALLPNGIAGYGIDFNPVVDRLRIVSLGDQNLRVNVDTGATIADTALAYAVGDANAGTNPSIVAAAYSNNFGGATSTVLRDLDFALNILATQNPPNDGTLNTQFSLGVDFTVAGYDISGLSGTPYASFIVSGQNFSGFYSISGSGASLIGSVGTGVALLDIAAPVGIQQFPIPEPGSLGLLAAGALALVGARRRRV